jgi:hypothetical protein
VVRQSYSTKEMIWDFGEVLEYLSKISPSSPATSSPAAPPPAPRRQIAPRPDGIRPLDLFLKFGVHRRSVVAKDRRVGEQDRRE